jgi:hypothetical protein
MKRDHSTVSYYTVCMKKGDSALLGPLESCVTYLLKLTVTISSFRRTLLVSDGVVFRHLDKMYTEVLNLILE